MKYKIGVFGSSTEETSDDVNIKAHQLGKELARKDIILITGASSGVPYMVSYVAAKSGTEVWGYSPMLGIDGQKEFSPKDDISIYKKLIFIPKNFEFASNLQVCKKYRNVISTANCDAGIIISGRWGTLNEFTNLYDMGKVIGVLTKTGGIADELSHLNNQIRKKSKAKVIFSDSPKELVEKIIKELQDRMRLYTYVIASETY